MDLDFENGAILVAKHIHRTNSIKTSFQGWHKRVMTIKHRSSRRRRALEHWSATTLHSTWLQWLRHLGYQRSDNLAQTHYKQWRMATSFLAWRQSVCMSLSQRPPVAPAAAAAAALVSLLPITVRLPMTTTNSTNSTNSTTPPLHPSSSSTTIKITPSVTPSRRRKRMNKRSTKSSSQSRSVGRRSWTAYIHAASKLTLRVFVAWSHQVHVAKNTRARKCRLRSLAHGLIRWRASVVLASARRKHERIAATHRVRSVLSRALRKLRQYATECLESDERDRRARRFVYLRLLRGSMQRWRRLVMDNVHERLVVRERRTKRTLLARWYVVLFFFYFFSFPPFFLSSF